LWLVSLCDLTDVFSSSCLRVFVTAEVGNTKTTKITKSHVLAGRGTASATGCEVALAE